MRYIYNDNFRFNDDDSGGRGLPESFKPGFLKRGNDSDPKQRWDPNNPDAGDSPGSVGGKAGELADKGKQAVHAAKEVGKTAKDTFGGSSGGAAAGAKGTQGVGKALKSAEDKSNKSDSKEPDKMIAGAEAAGKTGVRAAGAVAAVGLAAVGDEAHAARIAKNLAQQIAAHPIKFMKETKTGILVIGGIGALTLATMVLMFVFIANFAITHISQTAKDAALKLTTLDEAASAGRAVVSAVGKGVSGIGNTLFGDANLPQATLANTPGGQEPGGDLGAIQLAQQQSEEVGGEETEVTRLLEQVDMTKILKNLGEEGLLKVLSNGREIPLEELSQTNPSTVQLKIGAHTIDLTQDPTDASIMQQLTLAIRESNLFAHNSRTMVSAQIKKIYADAGIQLERWEGNAEEITDYGKNIESAHTSVSQGMQKSSAELADVDQAGEKIDSVATGMLQNNPSAGEKNYPKRVSDGSWNEATGEKGAGSITAFATKYQDSPGLFTIASYCSARSYLASYNLIVKQQYIGALRNGMKLLSAADQVKVGNTRRQATGAESQRHESYETSRSYLKAINADVRSRTPDLNESQLAYQDPRVMKAAMQSVATLFESPLGDDGVLDGLSDLLGGGDDGGGFSLDPREIAGTITDRLTDVLSGLIDAATSNIDTILNALGQPGIQEIIAREAGKLLCKGLSNDGAELAIQIADRISSALPVVPGAGDVGRALVLQNVRKSLTENNAQVLATQLGLDGSVFNKPTEEMMYFMFDNQKALNYAGLDDGVDLVSKEFEGAVAFGNEVARAGGGRPLDVTECAIAKGVTDQQNAVIRNSKPLIARLFSPEETYSPVSLALAHAPLSTNGALNKTRTALKDTVNPLNTLVASVQKVAYATTLADNVAFAQAQSTEDDFAEDNTLCYGYSVGERERVANDPAYWPVQNSRWVKDNLASLESRFKDCYEKPMYELIVADPNDSNGISPYGEGKCNGQNLSTDDALRYRTYRGDIMQLQSLVSFQTISADVALPGAGGEAPAGVVPETETAVTTGCGGIRVHTSIVSNVEALCAAAAASGVQLSGGGWRDPQQQISLREQHCGSGHYNIYEKPSSQCRPPTARPGNSMHERGLAIDFENCSSHGTACFQWLSANAAQFGLINLPVEPWHWSTTGK